MAVQEVGFRTFTKSIKNGFSRVELSAMDIIPYSKWVIQSKNGKTVYDIYHPGNKVTSLLRNGTAVKNETLFNKIIRQMAQLCCENGIVPRNLLNSLSSKDAERAMKSMRRS